MLFGRDHQLHLSFVEQDGRHYGEGRRSLRDRLEVFVEDANLDVLIGPAPEGLAKLRMQFGRMAFMDDYNSDPIAVGRDTHKRERPVQRNPLFDIHALAQNTQFGPHMNEEPIIGKLPEIRLLIL